MTSRRMTDDELAAIRQRASGVDLLAFHNVRLAQDDRVKLLAEVDALRAQEPPGPACSACNHEGYLNHYTDGERRCTVRGCPCPGLRYDVAPPGAWTDLLPETGERGALPPERRLVLLRVGVRDEARRTLTEQPDVYAVGYVRHGSGGHYFVIPGYPADFIVRAWADVLPSGLSLWSINTGERT